MGPFTANSWCSHLQGSLYRSGHKAATTIPSGQRASSEYSMIVVVALVAASALGSASPSAKRGLCFTPNKELPEDNKVWTKPGSDLSWYYNYKCLTSHIKERRATWPNAEIWVTEYAYAHQDLGPTQ